MKKEFKVKQNTAVLLFQIAYVIYMVLLIVKQEFKALIPVGIMAVILFLFFWGFRPFVYEVGNRTVTIKYRIWKNKEIDLMNIEVICDPVSRWADIATRPHAIEIYSNTKKRTCFFPIERVEFVDAILKENKRIHCTVKEYTDVRRQLAKKQKKEEKRARKKALKEGREN